MIFSWSGFSLKDFSFKKNNFDLIRLLAALQVVIIHGCHHFEVEYGGWFLKVLSIFPGVPIFFVTSGFLISASLERSKSLGDYFKNRFLRIYPALWSCFLLSIATVFIFYSPDFKGDEFGKWVLAQVTIGQFYNPEFLRGYGVGVLNGSLWTIPVEIQFYLALPILYIIFRKVNWNSAFILSLTIILIFLNQKYIELNYYSDSIVTKLIGVSLFPYLYMFIFGILLQRNLNFVKIYLSKNAIFFLILYLIVTISSFLLEFRYSGNYLNPVSSFFLSLLVISTAYTSESRFSSILNGYDISYGIYIYHMVFVNVLIQLNYMSPLMNLLAMIIITIFTALISWKFIEKPSLSLKRYSIRDKYKI
jgi:peptidoglycan/LPS O-acetylase OafA/YrhL